MKKIKFHIWNLIGNKDNLSREQIKSASEFDMILTKIMILAGNYNLSFSVIESSYFWDLLKFVFKFGQNHHETNPGLIIQKPSHYHESQIKVFSSIDSASLTIDGGTIQYGHFLDFAISSTI